MRAAAAMRRVRRRAGLGDVAAGLLLLALPLAALAAETAPENLPLWEAGAGAGTLWIPAYKGSETMRSFTAPLPYFVYRGEVLRANRDGIGLSMLGADDWKLDLSLSGALPVQSTGTRRNGMRDLPLVGEIGPVLKYDIVRSAALQAQLRLPLRYASGLHFSGLQSVGWISDPGLWIFGTMAPGWEWGASLNVDYQSASYNRFYYSVDPRDATPGRPAYQAGGGYSGSDLRAGIVRRHGNLVVSGFIGLGDIAGARFADSPLVQRTTNYYSGLAVVWILDRSVARSRQGASGELQ